MSQWIGTDADVVAVRAWQQIVDRGTLDGLSDDEKAVVRRVVERLTVLGLESMGMPVTPGISAERGALAATLGNIGEAAAARVTGAVWETVRAVVMGAADVLLARM